MPERKLITLEEGWEVMQKCITKIKNILDGLPEPQFTSEEYMFYYTTVYNMCTQRPTYDYYKQLYNKYRETFQEYIASTVLPSLREKHGELLLKELVKRWSNHKVMVRRLSHFFSVIDQNFIPRRALPGLIEAGLTSFRDLVYKEINGKVRDAVICLIDQEREGEQIDRALLKNVVDIFVEIGMGQLNCYENDFEAAMLEDTAAYYSRKASNWILEDSCSDYMLKAEECLKREKDRVSHYLHSSSEQKLLEKVQHELLYLYANQLLEKEQSECHSVLGDDKDNRDSDQSISDYDEDFNRESFDGYRRKKMGLSHNNGTEMPLLHNGKDNLIYNSRRVFTSNSDEGMISDEEKTMDSKFPAISAEVKFKCDHLHGLESKNQDETWTWSSVLEDAKELVFLHENAGSFSSYMARSDPRKISKAASGSRGKTKPRFSFRYHSHMEETPLPSMVNDECDKSSMVAQLPVGVGALEHKAIDHSMTELLENLEEKRKKQSDVHKLPAKSLDVGNRHLESSMAELLEGLQDKSGHAAGASKNSKTKGRRLELSTMRDTSTLGNTNIDKEEAPETIGSETSSEDEASDQNQVKLLTPEMRVRTMADQFQEAFSAAAADNREILFTTSKQIGTGYYGRLLQVMQTEKERHTEFWKQLQTGAHSLDKVRCIDVKILSRCLDAKLIVCHCSLGENTEINECAQNIQMILDRGRREKTIIFSPTICGNVELEVGKLIRVHPPWYNIRVLLSSVIEYHIPRPCYEGTNTHKSLKRDLFGIVTQVDCHLNHLQYSSSKIFKVIEVHYCSKIDANIRIYCTAQEGGRCHGGK